MSTLKASMSLGDIVASLPKASDIFKKYRIDFCCGGKRPLSEAIEGLNISEKELLNELQQAYEEATATSEQKDFTRMTYTSLIDYIVNKHHVYVKRSLPEISELSTIILRVHGMNHPELFKVHKLFHELKTELDQHLIKEEELLFPFIKEYDKIATDHLLDKIHTVMQETEDEHEGAGDILKELRRITEDYTAPEDVCDTFRMTYAKLEEFEADLFEHIHLENNVMFKRLEASLKSA